MNKVIEFNKLLDWKKEIQQSNKKLVVAIGSFDILHVGHVLYLQEAKRMGDILLVGINDDVTIKKLKGEGRPINNENIRITMLAALSCVDFICVYRDETATSLLTLMAPDIYVKGGDYNMTTLNQKEKAFLENIGAKIAITPLIEGVSTSLILERIYRELHKTNC